MGKYSWMIASVAVVLFILGGYLLSLPTDQLGLPKVGILVANDLRLSKVDGLKTSLKQLGYQEGEGIDYQVANARNAMSQLAPLARELIAGKPNVLVAAGAVEAQALKEATAQMEKQIPVIFMGTLSPVEIGLVQNPVHPSGNLTGLNNYHFELVPKRLELLHRLLPEIYRVAVLGDTRIPFFEQTQSGVEKLATQFGIELHTYTASTPDEIIQSFQDMQRDRVEGIILLPGFFLESNTRQIVELALQRKLPVFGVYPQDTEEGCLASYGTSNQDQGIQSGHMVSKVLQGQSPRDIPVETPDKLVFSVNLKTAQSLGVTPSPSVLSFADRVIQP